MNRSSNVSSGKSKKRSRSNRAGRGSGPVRDSVVPWNQELLLTDRMRLPRVVGSTYRSLHTYVLDNWIAQSSSVAQTSAYAFVANASIPDFSSWASVFDQYRVIAVEVLLEPNATISGPGSSNTISGRLVTVIDYDDSNALSSLSAATAYDNAIITPSSGRCRRCFAPRIAVGAYGSGSFGQYANTQALWIDCASGSVAHYGIKAYIEPGTASFLQSYNLTTRSLVEFRNGR
jgi:hypothetical protein